MKRASALLAILLLITLPCKAQYRPTATLGISFGCGFTDFYEQGASPLTYFGLAASPGASLLVETVRWRFLFETTSTGGAYTNRFVSSLAFGGSFDSRFSVTRRLIDRGKRQRWIGLEANNLADIKYNDALMNASFALSNISTLGPRFQIQHDLPVTRRQHSYTIDADFFLPIVGVVYRPGYSYMSNYTGGTGGSTLDGYELSIGILNGARTSIGLTRNFYEYKVRLSYDWLFALSNLSGDYFPPGGSYLFAEGIHLLRLSINFRLNHQS